MKWMLIAVLCFACATSRARFEPVRTECRALVANGTTPAIAIAVAHHGDVILEEAFGAGTDTPFTLASTGKSMTGAVVLKLAERGVIDLDAPADRYVPLRVYEGEASRVTVRTLLRMGAGIPHLWWHHWKDDGKPRLTNAEVMRRYAMVVTPPDDGMYYSNTTYGLLAQIVENASHAPFAGVVQRELFAPLGMSHSSVHPASAGNYDYSDPEGAAGYRASIHDLIRYATSRMNQQTGDGYMAGWGHARDQSGIRFAIANGGIVGATSEIKILPDEGIAVACLANAPGINVSAIVDHAIEVLDPRYRGKAVIAEAFRDQPFVRDASLDGEWSGEVRTWERTLPAKLSMGDTITLQIGDDDAHPLTKLRMQNGLLRAECECRLPNSDADGEPSKIAVALRHEGGRLFGSASVISTGPRTSFCLPAYIALNAIRTASK